MYNQTAEFVIGKKQKHAVKVSREGRTWKFTVGRFQKLMGLRGGGRSRAVQVAKVIRAGFLRANQLDGLARHQLDQILHTRTLGRYLPDYIPAPH